MGSLNLLICGLKAAAVNHKHVPIRVLIVLTLSSTLLLHRVSAADPDPLADFLPDDNSTQFVFRNIFQNGAVTTGSGGVRAAINPSIFSGLTSQGVTVVHFRMKPCGENLPHTHPRATEILSLITGGPLQAGFVDTEGTKRLYIVNPRDVIVFPRGMVHFELNVGIQEAYYISALNSQNPGVLDTAGSVLSLPDRAAAVALNQDLPTIRRLKAARQYDDPPTLQAPKRGVCVPGQFITTSV